MDSMIAQLRHTLEDISKDRSDCLKELEDKTQERTARRQAQDEAHATVMKDIDEVKRRQDDWRKQVDPDSQSRPEQDSLILDLMKENHSHRSTELASFLTNLSDEQKIRHSNLLKEIHNMNSKPENTEKPRK